MTLPIWSRFAVVLLALSALWNTASGASAATRPDGARHNSQPFATLASGFKQSIYGVAVGAGLLNGVAFAPDGSVWADACSSNALVRFKAKSTYTQDGNTLHTEISVPESVGCGLTNGPGGVLYSNAAGGLQTIDATNGASLGFQGPAGNSFGIAVDPQTGNALYVGTCSPDPQCVISVNPADGTTSTFAALPAATTTFIDGMAVDPSGSYVFLASQAPAALLIVTRSGKLVESVPMTSAPDGIAVHASKPVFLVTDNTDGTMTRFDFAKNKFTAVPHMSQFAAGGFYSDHSQVGSDGCLYISQEGTAFVDGTTSGDPSVARICGGFAPAPADLPLALTVAGAQKNSLVTFKLHYVNHRSSTDGGIKLVDTIPSSVQYVSSSGPCAAEARAHVAFCIPNNKSGSVRVTVKPRTTTAGTIITDCASLTWTDKKDGRQETSDCGEVNLK